MNTWSNFEKPAFHIVKCQTSDLMRPSTNVTHTHPCLGGIELSAESEKDRTAIMSMQKDAC